MAQKRKKADNRPWVDKDDIIVYDGTKETIDKIHKKAKRMGGFVNRAVYNPVLKRLMEFNLYLNFSEEDFYIVSYKSVVVFTDLAILWFSSEKEALAAVRVRTGRARATILVEIDDKVIEWVIPAAYGVSFDVKAPVYPSPSWADPNHYIRIKNDEITLRFEEVLSDKDGRTHWQIDRVMNPDYVVPEFDNGTS